MISMHDNIFLVGMMGAGKSAVGRQLARRLGMTFVDSDHEICERTGVPIATVFELEGEAGFRLREERMIDELSRRSGVVMATGGGAVLSPVTRAHLRERGTTLYLHARVQDLWQRTRNDRNRPLLACADPRRRLEDLLTEREQLYREVAHLVINTGKPTVSRLVGTIIEQLELAMQGGSRVDPAAASPSPNL
jgi:shikimate kinase